ncbi:hypothetical protein KHF85_05745 [Xanthomonas translucens pv. graminis]|uniref:hypothetical protein n=1 Tax=Xanthomonas graminis TaxID=3390026 RepID=UPI00253FC72E|nr:hypothetical protein [Xanthomonas translucens]WIH05959.1 hypothetical protein KHF85_05745 [Xanthomonas translucens pv. graminis]
MATRTLKSHAIATSLMRLQELLNDPALQSPDVASDEQAQFNRDKLQNITKSLRSLVNQSTTTLVSETALNQMNANLQAPISELTAFVTNRNMGHLANAVAQVDQNVLKYTWAFTPKVNPLSKADIGELIDSLQERSRQTIEQLNSQRELLEARVSEVNQSLLQQEARLTEMKEAQALSKAEMAASLANLEIVFNKAELQRDSSFAELVKEAKSELEQAQKDFTETSQGFMTALEQHKHEAERIVQAVGDTGVTGNYRIIANQESTQANRWRWITVGLFACGLCMAVATFYKFYHEPVNATNTLAIAVRLLYALAIAAPAFYTARESARHRTNADRARQTELELASLGPFIELMEDRDKEEIRKSLIPTYFGRQVDAHEIKPLPDVSVKPKG